MHGLLHRLVNRVRVQPEHRAEAGSGGWAQVRDVILLVRVQADAAYEIHLDFVGDGEAVQEVCTVTSALLRHGEQRRNVIRRMRVIRREERVVHVEFAHRHAIGPRRPFALKTLLVGDAKDRRPARARMRQRLRARIGDGGAIDGGDGDGGVVDDAVDDHLRDLRQQGSLVRGDGSELPRQLLDLRQRLFRWIDSDAMGDHACFG